MRLSLGQILQCLICFTTTIGFLGLLFLDEPHPYIDWQSHLLFLLLSLVMAYGCRRPANFAPINLVVITTLYAFVVSRIAFLYWYPEGFLGHERLSPEIFAGTLLYILLGTAVAIIAVLVVEATGRLRAHPTLVSHRQVGAQTAVLFFLLICVAKLLSMLFDETFGFTGATGSGEHLGFIERYFTFLINPLAACLTAIVAIMHGGARTRKLGLKPMQAILGCLLCYAIYLSVSGSRGAIFEAVLIGVSFWVIVWGNAKANIRRDYLLFAGGLISLSIAVWPFVTAFRELAWYGDRDTFSSIPLAFEQAYLADTGTALEKLAPISQRVSLLESTLFPLYAEELGFGAVSDLVNFESLTFGTLSRVLPGKPFGDYIFGEYAFGFFLGKAGVRYDSAKLTNFVGYEWGMFGIAFQVFGYVGGLIFIFICTGAIAAVVRIYRARSDPFSHLIALYFCYTMNSWVHNLGFDNLVDRTVRIGVVVILYAILLGLLQLGRRKSVSPGTLPYPHSALR